MTRIKVDRIVNNFFEDMNPTFWNGTGDKPSTFDERIWEYILSETDRLDISFEYDDYDGWHHCCELVDVASNTMTEILSGYGIDSTANLGDTIMDLCKEYE